MRSAIYQSVVTHQRFQPMGHRLRYRVWSMLFDLDELGTLGRRIPFFSYNRPNLISFNSADYGPRDGSDLKEWFTDLADAAGVDLTGGSVQLLAFPRILGYTFNPITVWLGHDSEDTLRVIMYEVHNTFGHQHSQLVVIEPTEARTLRHELDKVLHVSPFFDQEGSYRVSIRPPDERYSLAIEYVDDAGDRLLTATQSGSRDALTSRNLLRAFLRSPALTLKVIGGIHWEALKLLTKGARYRSVPPPPAAAHAVTRPRKLVS